MTTEIGRKHCIARLSAAPNLAALRKVWESFGTSYQADPIVKATKDQLKAGMAQDPRGSK